MYQAPALRTEDRIENKEKKSFSSRGLHSNEEEYIVSYGCCNKLLQIGGLKQHTFIVS